MLSKMATVEIIDDEEQIEQTSDIDTMMEMPPNMENTPEILSDDLPINIQEELENAADDLDSNYDDYEYDEALGLENDYLDNYENELNYGDVLGQFLEDEDGKNIAENLADLVKVMKDIRDLFKISITKNCNAIDQNSKCIIKLQKTIESITIDNIPKKK